MTCDQAEEISIKKQYKEVSFAERIKLKLHLIICKTCSDFSKKNAQLSLLCKKANLQNLSERDKSHMKQKLKEKI